MYYNFPDNGCDHSNYSKGKCEWESNGKIKSNYIYECRSCHEFAETNVKEYENAAQKG